MADLLTFRTRVRERAGIDTGDALFPDSTLDALINASLAELTASADYYWLRDIQTFTVTKDQASYALASNVTRVRWATVAYDEYTDELAPYRRGDIGRLAGDSGCPTAYALDSSNVILAPTPAETKGTLTLGIVVAEAPLVLTTDVPRLPSHYADALASTAAHKAAVRAGDQAMAELLASEKAMWLVVLRDQLRRDTAAPRVKVERSWTGGR